VRRACDTTGPSTVNHGQFRLPTAPVGQQISTGRVTPDRIPKLMTPWADATPVWGAT
jgi:hypothetical protein